MSGAGDHRSGAHVSSWGWKEVTVNFKADLTPIVETWRVWRCTLNNKLLCELVMPPDMGAGDVLMHFGEMELLRP